MKNKIILLTLALVASLSITACNNSSVSDNNTEKETVDDSSKDKTEDDKEEADEESDDKEAEEEASDENDKKEGVTVDVFEFSQIPEDEEFQTFCGEYYLTNKWVVEDKSTNYVTLYNKKGDIEKQLVFENADDASNWGCWYYHVGEEFFILVNGIKDYCDDKTCALVDQNGNIIWTDDKIAKQLPSEVYYYDGKLTIDIETWNGDFVGTYDVATNEKITVDKDKIDYRPYKNTEIVEDFDTSKFSQVLDDKDNGFYLISTVDEKWGFADYDYNILALYEDVCCFNNEGYALASDDRVTYYIIDTNFERVSDDTFEGISSSYYKGANCIGLKMDDEHNRYYWIY